MVNVSPPVTHHSLFKFKHVVSHTTDDLIIEPWPRLVLVYRPKGGNFERLLHLIM
jgi:hypothetical protein